MTIGKEGVRPGEFFGVNGVALDAQGFLYVAETVNDRVQRFAPDGSPAGMWGTRGTSTAQFTQLSAIALHPTGAILTAEWQFNRIQKFDSTGTFLPFG